jgi:hypothetical protein
MTTDEIKDWMRIYALEILAVNHFAVDCIKVAPDDPLGLVARLRDQMIAGARRHGFPGLDAASSDLASAELEDAVGRLMEMAGAQINVVLQRRTGSRPVSILRHSVLRVAFGIGCC